MIPANRIKEISSKIHDTTIGEWVDEVESIKKGDCFPTKTHWWILLSIAIVVGSIGFLILLT